MTKRLSIDQRFVIKVASPDENGCMLWTSAARGRGYGGFRLTDRTVLAHRFSYELFVGPIPDGLTLDHTCKVRRCVNPDHLEPVTSQVNTLRGSTITAGNMAKLRCPADHEYSLENTYMKGGRRVCRKCRRRQWSEWYARNGRQR